MKFGKYGLFGIALASAATLGAAEQSSYTVLNPTGDAPPIENPSVAARAEVREAHDGHWTLRQHRRRIDDDDRAKGRRLGSDRQHAEAHMTLPRRRSIMHASQCIAVPRENAARRRLARRAALLACSGVIVVLAFLPVANQAASIFS